MRNNMSKKLNNIEKEKIQPYGNKNDCNYPVKPFLEYPYFIVEIPNA